MTDIEKRTEKPYQEKDGYRIFNPDIDEVELEWHIDMEDRTVIVIQGGGWFFQYDGEVPFLLEDGQSFFIPKEMWHRVLRGNKQLIIKIIT